MMASARLATVALFCTAVGAQESVDQAAKIDPLIRLLHDEATWDAAAGQLFLIGKPAAKPLGEALVEAANGGHEEIARRILAVIARLGLRARDAMPQVWKACRQLDRDGVVHCWDTARVVSPLGDRSCIGELMKSLQDVIARVPRDARALVRGMSPVQADLAARARLDSATDVTKLRELLAEQRPDKVAICQLLGQKGRPAKACVPALCEVLKTAMLRSSGQPAPRVVKARTGRRPKPPRAAPTAPTLARAAADAILSIDPSSSEAAVALGYLLVHDPIRHLRLRSARELQVLGHDMERALPMLIQALRRYPRDTELVGVTLNCLGMLGPQANGAASFVLKFTRSEDPKTARRAKAVLRRIRQKHP